LATRPGLSRWLLAGFLALTTLAATAGSAIRPAQALGAPSGAANCPAAPDCAGANAPYAFSTRDFRIPVPVPDMFGNPVTLDARLLTPVGAGPFAGLLINHGYLGSKTDDGATAEAAARAGYLVLRYSSRGFGDIKGQVDLVGDPEISDMLTAVHSLNNPGNAPVWVNHLGHYGGSSSS